MFKPLPLYIGLSYTRAKRRNNFISFISAASMVGIILGIVALIVVLSVMNGFDKEMRERILSMAAHGTVQGPYAGVSLPDYQDEIEKAKKIPDIIGAAPYVEVQAMLTANGIATGALIQGIDPTVQEEVSDIRKHMIDGNLDSLEDDQFNVILGKDLAQYLHVEVGSKVILLAPQLNSTVVGVMPRFKEFTVSGIFSVGMSEFDRNAGYVHLKDGARLMALGDDVSGIRLRFNDMWNVKKIRTELAKEFPEGQYWIVDWTQTHANFFSALAMEKRMMSIVLFLIVVVAASNLVSMLVMVVTDKQSDIAVLRTLGMSPGRVMSIFIVQGTTIGFIGTILGVLFGVLLAWNVEPVVSAIERVLGIHFLDPSIYYISSLPSVVNYHDVALIGIVSFIMSILATLYPAWRAACVMPAEALRYE